MLLRRLRLYIDTSVFDGCFDEEFEVASKRVVQLIQSRRCTGLVSEIVINEIQKAPEPVRHLFESLAFEHLVMVPLNDEVLSLRDAYLAAGVLGER